MELRNPSQYRLEELRAFAIRAFAERRVHTVAEFEPYEDPDDEEGDDEYEEDDEDVGSSDDDSEAVEAGADEEDGESEEGETRIFRRLTEEWSRPRMVSRVLRRLGWDVPSQLRTSRFQELIASLKEHGIDACLAYDDRQQVLTAADESPGIAAKLRLRRLDQRDDRSPQPSYAATCRTDRSGVIREPVLEQLAGFQVSTTGRF